MVICDIELLCNRAEQGVCCSPCDLGQVCVPEQDCPSFVEEKEQLTSLDLGSREHISVKKKLNRKICDKKAKTVCCERVSRCSKRTNRKLRNYPVSFEKPESCDPTKGSCLPGPEKCGLVGVENCGDVCLRVVNGENATPSEFPFTALLGRKFRRGRRSTFGYVFTCGGTLINMRYVVTAAQCHHPTDKKQQINLVRLGEFEVSDRRRRDCTEEFCLEDIQEFDLKPEDILIHPDFQKESDGSFTNDIALIRLPKPAKENLAVRVACLPINPTVAANDLNVPDIQEGLSSTVATIVGWGITSSDPTTRLSGNREKVGFSIQQKLAVPVLSRAECRRRNVEPKTQQICAGGEVGKGFCTVSTEMILVEGR